jgi:hypothetical protein
MEIAPATATKLVRSAAHTAENGGRQLCQRLWQRREPERCFLAKLDKLSLSRLVRGYDSGMLPVRLAFPERF